MTGDLRSRARAVRALETGALVPLASERHTLPEGFLARILVRRDEKRAHAARGRRDGENPFLPYDEDLFVCELPPAHFCLLNKFTVVEEHLLIVTARFVDQRELLDAADFEALYAVLLEIDGVGFYNAGTEAGASQPHKHLQLVPAPLGEGPARFPTEPLLEAAAAGGTTPSLPFAHAVAHLSEPSGRCAGAAYASLRARLALDEATPYNLLATRELLALVPRTRERWDDASINALGFAGSFLVRDAGQLERLRTLGPLAALASVAAPPRMETP